MQRPLLNSIEAVTNAGLMTDKFRGVITKLTNNLPIIGSGSPEGVQSALQYSWYMDSVTEGGVWIKRLTDIGGDDTLGWENVDSPDPLTSIRAYAAKAADYTLTADDYLINVTVAGTIITSLTAVGIEGQEFEVKNSSTGNITFNAAGIETIDGTNSWAIQPTKAMKVMSDGANLLII